MTQDYARKNWVDKQFRDWMRQTPAKAVWNNVLKQYPRAAEFSRLPSIILSEAIRRWLIQSEFKKPHGDFSFPEMESNWNRPPGFRDDIPGPDQPWNLQTPYNPATFDAEVSGGWCAGTSREITITGTNPIYLLSITFGVGVRLTGIGGYGTNTVVANIITPSTQVGFVTIEVSMRTSDGVPGDSNVDVFEDRDCDVCPGATMEELSTNPETVAPSGSVEIGFNGGLPPYSWTVGGTGFTLSSATTGVRLNTVNASAGSCGSCTVQVTDKCGQSLTMYVRSTSGKWSFYSTGCQTPGQPPDPGTNGEWATKGKWQQRDNFINCWLCSSSGPNNCPCDVGGSSGSCANNTGCKSGTPCVQWDCGEIVGAGYAGNFLCCYNSSTDSCGNYYVQYNHIYEWVCP